MSDFDEEVARARTEFLRAADHLNRVYRRYGVGEQDANFNEALSVLSGLMAAISLEDLRLLRGLQSHVRIASPVISDSMGELEGKIRFLSLPEVLYQKVIALRLDPPGE